MTAQCYDFNTDTNQVENLPIGIWVPCPETLGCCVTGDFCLTDNLCHTNKTADPTSAASYSQYYVARCSDPTYTSPDCQKVCNAPGPPDAVYNYGTNLWNCCGTDATGNVSCNDPKQEAFQAPGPAQLATINSGAVIASTATLIPGTVKPSSTADTTTLSSQTLTTNSMTTASSAPSSASSSPSPGFSNSGLSTGAKAGIGVGVALGVIAIIAILAFFLIRRRRLASKSPVYGAAVDKKGPLYQEKSAASDHVRAELSPDVQSPASRNNRTELSGTSTSPQMWHELDCTR